MDTVRRSFPARLIVGYAAVIAALGLPHALWAADSPDIVTTLSACTLYAPASVTGIALGIEGTRRYSPSARTARQKHCAALTVLAVVPCALLVAITLWNALHASSMSLPAVPVLLTATVPFLCLASAAVGTILLVQGGRTRSQHPGPLSSRRMHLVAVLIATFAFAVTTSWTWVIVDGPLLSGTNPFLHVAFSLGCSALIAWGVWQFVTAETPREGISLPLAMGAVLSYALCRTYDLTAVSAPSILRIASIGIACLAYAALRKQRNTNETCNERHASQSQESSVATLATLGAFDLPKSERVAVELALTGLSSTKIGAQMDIAPATVRSYLQRAYRKLGVSSLQELRSVAQAQAGASDLSSPDPKPRTDASETPDVATKPRCSLLLGCAILCLWMLLAALAVLSPNLGSGLTRSAAVLGLGIGLLARPFAMPHIRTRGVRLACTISIGTLIGIPLIEPILLCTGSATGVALPIPSLRAALLLSYIALGMATPGILHHGLSMIARTSDEPRAPFAATALAASALFFIAHLSPMLWAAVASMTLLFAIGTLAKLAARAASTPSSSGQTVPRATPRSPLPQKTGLIFLLALDASLTALYRVDGILALLAVAFPLLCTAVIIMDLVATDRATALALTASASIVSLVVALTPSTAQTAEFTCASATLAGTLALFAFASLLPRHTQKTLQPARDGVSCAAGAGLLVGSALSSLIWLAEVAARASDPYLSAPSNIVAPLNPATMLTLIQVTGIALCLAIMLNNLAHTRVPCSISSVVGAVQPANPYEFLRSRGLTDTEARIVAEIAQGLSGKEIARKLAFAPGTVNAARYRGYRKLGITSKQELAELLGPCVVPINRTHGSSIANETAR